MFTEMCDDFIRKTFPTMYAGTLDGRKGIVFAQVLTDYGEWNLVLELGLIEASQNQVFSHRFIVVMDTRPSQLRNSTIQLKR